MAIFNKLFNLHKEGLSREIEVTEPGTLAQLISDSELYDITRLVLHGQVNGLDLRVLRDMCGYNYRGVETKGRLATLDLSDVRIVTGGRGYIRNQRGYFEVKCENVLPERLFRKCESLAHVALPRGTVAIESHAFERCSHLQYVDIPDSVTVIGQSAFRLCTDLYSIILPASVSEIGQDAFADCHRLRSLICLATNPPQIVIDTFFNLDLRKIQVKVPEQAVEVYKKTQFWKRMSKMEAL